MNHKALIGTAALGLALIGTAAAATSVSALPACGGQGAANLVGPSGFDCQNAGTFQGVGYTLLVHVNQDRTYGLTFTLAKKVPVKVGLQARAHPHLSGDPGVMESFTTLPAGELSTVWGGQFPAGNLCDPHQLDVKAQPGVEGAGGHWDEKWRISGATFVFATPAMGCGVTTVPTTVAPTTAPTPSGSTSAPGTTGVPSPGSSVVPTSAGVQGVTLPATGGDGGGGNAGPLALVAIGLGGLAVYVTRKRAVQ